MALLGWSAPPATARSIVVADGVAARLVDVSTGKLGARFDVGGRARGAAVAPDGSRAYVSGTERITAIDLASQGVAGMVTTRPTVLSLAITPDGRRLYAARSGAIDVIDAASMTIVRAIALGRSRPSAIAVSGDGTRAVVLLDAKRVGVVDLRDGGRLARRVPLAGATGVAFDPSGLLARVLTVGDPTPVKAKQRGGKRRPRRPDTDARLVALDAAVARTGAEINLGQGVGGGVAVSRNGRYAIAGARSSGTVTSVVDLATRRQVARVKTGRGPGAPAVSPDGARLYIADRGDAAISVLSQLSFKRLRRLGLGRAPRRSRWRCNRAWPF
jgi:DNA-binding beta-propeller fold protein YncE